MNEIALKPRETCHNCGANLREYDEIYTIWIGKTLCPDCFFKSLGNYQLYVFKERREIR